MISGSGIFVRIMVALFVYSDVVTAKLHSSKSNAITYNNPFKDNQIHICPL